MKPWLGRGGKEGTGEVTRLQIVKGGKGEGARGEAERVKVREGKEGEKH